MKLTRDKIQRMIGSAGYGSSAGSSGGGGGDIIGYATQTWVKSLRWWGATFDQQATDPDNVTGALTGVTNITASGNITAGGNLTVTGNITSSGTITGATLAATTAMTLGGKAVATQEWTGQNYVSIAFFSRLFQAYNGSTAVNPNDLTTTIDNIKAMFGFWTDQYLTALGKNPNVQPSSLYLSQLADVSIPSPTDGQVLTYSSTVGKWIASNASSGTDMATVWANLAAADSSKQIDASHLTTAAATLFTSLVMSGNDLSMTIGGVTKSLTVGYATNARNADYLTTYNAYGNNNLECLQNIYSSLPKEVGTSVLLNHGTASMAFGWFLDHSYETSFGGWFISDYDTPSWVGVYNGVWTSATFITSNNIGSQSVNYATSAGNAGYSTSSGNADYLTTYNAYGNSNLECLQNIYSSLPKEVGTSVLLHHGTASMAFGWFLDHSYETSYGGWFISDYDTPSWVGVYNGVWTSATFITSNNIGSQSVSYATSAGDAATLGGTAKDGLFTDFSNITTGADAGKVGITIGGTTRALAVDAATLGGTAKSGLFTSLSSTWATNLSATIGGTTLSVSSLNANYAGQLRYSHDIWGQSFNGTADVDGDLFLAGRNLRLLDYNNSADCYIVGYRTGNSRAIGVAVEGSSLFEFNDEEFYSAVGIYAASYVTALSDIRYKDVIRHFALDAETIANASIIQFKWKDGTDQATHVGGIAQEWQAFLPEAVHETKDGKLSMDYGVIAYTAAVSLAKKVVSQQQEIDDLKQRLERLERLLSERKDAETQRKSL